MCNVADEESSELERWSTQVSTRSGRCQCNAAQKGSLLRKMQEPCSLGNVLRFMHMQKKVELRHMQRWSNAKAAPLLPFSCTILPSSSSCPSSSMSASPSSSSGLTGLPVQIRYNTISWLAHRQEKVRKLSRSDTWERFSNIYSAQDGCMSES